MSAPIFFQIISNESDNSPRSRCEGYGPPMIMKSSPGDRSLINATISLHPASLREIERSS